MAVAGIRLSVSAPDMEALSKELDRIFDNPSKSKIVKAAIDEALAPALQALKRTTPVGPTGNLKAAAAKKSVAYPNDGNAVGLVGYRRAGRERTESAAGGRVKRATDRAFHQWWLEYGTNERSVTRKSETPFLRRGHVRRTKSGEQATVAPHQVKGQGAVIASSYRSLGPFQFLNGAIGVSTDPQYPRAFFKKGKVNEESIRIPPMLPGGLGEPPLQAAWSQSQATVVAILQQRLRVSLDTAWRSLSFSATGSINDP